MVQPVIKRGGFAKDRRTGMVYKIAEIGGRDMMVRPAYKSDGVWVAPEHLQAVQDPHIWGARQLLIALGIVAFAAWTAYSTFQNLTGQGVGGQDAFWSGALPTGTLLMFVFGNLFGLNRS